MSDYPAQAYSERLDAVDAALKVVGTSFQPGFSNNVNGLQRFQVLANGGDGYATFDFRSEHTPSLAPEVSLRVNADEGLNVQHSSSFLSVTRNAVSFQRGGRFFLLNDSGFLVSDPANFRTAINGASLAGNNFTGLQTFTGIDSVGIRLKSLTSAQYGNLTPGNGDMYLDTTTNRIDARINGTTRELIDSSGGQTINGNLTASGQLFVNSINNYYDNPSSGQGRWQTPFAGIYTFQQNQAGQSMTVQLATSELKLAGLQHWDVASGNGRRLDLFSQSAVPITVRPAGVLAMTWDTSGNTIASGTVRATSFWAGPGNSTTINGDAGAVFLQTGGFNRWQISANHWVPSANNVYDLGSTTNRVRDLYVGGISATGTIVTTGACNSNTATVSAWVQTPALDTNSMARRTPTSTLNLGVYAVPTAFPNVTILSSLTNSTGIAEQLRINSTINQTGTAGSADILINRTETAIGSGTHRYIDLQNAGTSRWYVDRSGDQYFCQGADSTRIARAAGATGRLIIYRPNDPATPSIEFGGGNDEIRIRGGLGTLTHSGTQFQIGSTAAMTISATVGSLSLGSNGSTTLTMTGADSVFGGSISWSDVRIQRVAKTFRTECFESTLSAWQETSRQEASATGPRWSVMGATPIVRQTHAAVATDLATAITRLNTLCTHLTNFGLFN